MGVDMNEKQKQLLLGVGAVMAAMLLFPPYHGTGGGGVDLNFGYGFIFSPPNPIALVNVGLLFVQELTVGAIGFIGWYFLKEKK